MGTTAQFHFIMRTADDDLGTGNIIVHRDGGLASQLVEQFAASTPVGWHGGCDINGMGRYAIEVVKLLERNGFEPTLSDYERDMSWDYRMELAAVYDFTIDKLSTVTTVRI
jgi:hypothetical protein